MLEFLSDGKWLEPQINYLLALQNFRIISNGIFDKLFLSITAFGEILYPTIIMCIIYWCIDFKSGFYLLTLNSFSNIISHFLKLIACVYRPWFLCDKIQPVDAARKLAGGYSFPSGHSSTASSTWGGLAFLLRKKVFICAILVFIPFVIGFSRTYLGVHTPQDVIVGLAIGFVLIFALNSLYKLIDNRMKTLIFLTISNIVILLTILINFTKTNYPVTYLNGKILYDYNKALCINSIFMGWGAGIINGTFLCKAFFQFETKNISLLTRFLRGLIGTILIFLILHEMDIHLFTNVKTNTITFIVTFLAGFFITIIYPIIFVNCEKLVSKIQNKKP